MNNYKITENFTLKIERFYYDEKCTIGRADLKDRVIYFLEPPWRDNKRFKSCIPTGIYTVKKRWSPKYKWHWHIKGVKGRTFILIHTGNYPKNTTGCLLPGLLIDMYMDKVSYSRKALNYLNSVLPDKFELEIVEDF